MKGFHFPKPVADEILRLRPEHRFGSLLGVRSSHFAVHAFASDSSSLDQIARWDKELTDEKQQFLILTRIMLHKPRLIVIDEALDPLDDDARNRLLRLLVTNSRTQAS